MHDFENAADRTAGPSGSLVQAMSHAGPPTDPAPAKA